MFSFLKKKSEDILIPLKAIEVIELPENSILAVSIETSLKRSTLSEVRRYLEGVVRKKNPTCEVIVSSGMKMSWKRLDKI